MCSFAQDWQAFKANVLASRQKRVCRPLFCFHMFFFIIYFLCVRFFPLQDFEVPICELLLNQRYFNGIGNYLRAEILCRAGVEPFSKSFAVLNNGNRVCIRENMLVSLCCVCVCKSLCENMYFVGEMVVLILS